MTNDNHKPHDKLVPAYQQMLTRLKEILPHPNFKNLRERIATAQEKAVGLEELTLEEAERIGDYLRRDIEDAAQFIVTTRQALADWMRFDLELIEDRLLDMFSLAVDHTRLELENLAELARHATDWCSGEITGPGTLYCDSCEQALYFHKPDYIPVCPNCGGTLFRREVESEEETE
jgi:predicted RNA-binding Zn-ribbon protein involved in translation (DUF1610 family)